MTLNLQSWELKLDLAWESPTWQIAFMITVESMQASKEKNQWKLFLSFDCYELKLGYMIALYTKGHSTDMHTFPETDSSLIILNNLKNFPFDENYMGLLNEVKEVGGEPTLPVFQTRIIPSYILNICPYSHR